MADEELEALDRLLAQLGRILAAPADPEDGSAESTWQKVDLLESSMGTDALAAMLRRQGMTQTRVDHALAVLDRRRAARS